jgi:putative lipoprotein
MITAGCSSPKLQPAPRDSTRSPAASTVSLADTTWKLVELDGRPARADEQGSLPDLRLDSAQHRAGGNAGCNRYFGTYASSQDSLHFGPLAATRRACLDAAMTRQETAFLQALDRSRTYRVASDTLTLLGESGTIARFVMAASN